MTPATRERKYLDHVTRVVSALNDAGLIASDKRVEGYDAFVVVWLADTRGRRARGNIETSLIEIESWAPRPSAAWDQLSRARGVISGLLSVAGIRRVEETSGPSNLPPQEQGWDRYRMQVEITGPTY